MSLGRKVTLPCGTSMLYNPMECCDPAAIDFRIGCSKSDIEDRELTFIIHDTNVDVQFYLCEPSQQKWGEFVNSCESKTPGEYLSFYDGRGKVEVTMAVFEQKKIRITTQTNGLGGNCALIMNIPIDVFLPVLKAALVGLFDLDETPLTTKELSI